MDYGEKVEARLVNKNTILVILSKVEDESLVKNFCGTTLIIEKVDTEDLPNLSDKVVYLCGDIGMAKSLGIDVARQVFYIAEMSYGLDNTSDLWQAVSLGKVPISIDGMGVYYRQFFDPDFDYFNKISEEHAFQFLTESTKFTKARRTGIYLTPVERDKDGLHFRLLRCSTNLTGPTENFCSNDWHIVNALNLEADIIFKEHASLNHVLAQIYRNTSATDKQKQAKARISLHADKTKDMPENGIMAFCTFYDQLEKLQPLSLNGFDYGYKNISGLTKLRFVLKNAMEKDSKCSLPNEFTITLYPGSVFFMPLSTNRLYTHEIRPAALDANILPTRLGYVVRCSEAEAVHNEGSTYLKKHGGLIKLEAPSEEGMVKLRKLYSQENKTEDYINYGDDFLFSMNEGDYKNPEYKLKNKFRKYSVSTGNNYFYELSSGVQLENQGKGRRGAVLVSSDMDRGVPIVRTTTKYSLPAQSFLSLHRDLALTIQQCASLPMELNNALLENYTNEYKKMGFHSDQAQDLEDNSYIAIFSCYKHPELKSSRKLIIESKEADGENIEILLEHNSVIVFSLEMNRKFKHKIVLDASSKDPENEWVGITFRSSKTFIKYVDSKAYFEDGACLTMANEENIDEFYPLRRRENTETNYLYPPIKYTLSESDMLTPKNLM